ncbi:DUF1826 domain-containing protein, partial [Paracoccus sp. PAMC 22219]|uniref:DUF1826 domain-containing protein n=1 Tax=Paracoccus sp. PAMC 22219 TaxID=1569209 RepID=UPI0005AB8343
MNQRVVLRPAPAPATAMNSGHDPRVLGTIALPGVAVALWQRFTDAAWQAWLDALAPERLPRLRLDPAPAGRGGGHRGAWRRGGAGRCDHRRGADRPCGRPDAARGASHGR